MERNIERLVKIAEENRVIFGDIREMIEIYLKSQDEIMFYKDHVFCDRCLFQSKYYSSAKYIKQYKNMSRDQQRQEDSNRHYIFDSCLKCNPKEDKIKPTN